MRLWRWFRLWLRGALMPVHIEDLSTTVSVEATPPESTDAASPWEEAADRQLAARRMAEVEARTRSEAFDD